MGDRHVGYRMSKQLPGQEGIFTTCLHFTTIMVDSALHVLSDCETKKYSPVKVRR